MTKFQFDPWLVETEAALWGLREYLEVIEEQIGFVEAQRRVRLKADLAKSGADWDEAQVNYQELDLLVEHVFPRSFRAGFVLVVWGAFEAGVSEIAQGLQRHFSAPLKLREIRGDNFLDQTRKYFETILVLQLVEADEDIANLNDLLNIRNGFAHANGRLTAMNDKTRGAVEAVVEKGTGVTIDWGDLVIDAEFCRLSFDCVDRSLRSLVKRAREKRKVARTS